MRKIDRRESSTPMQHSQILVSKGVSPNHNQILVSKGVSPNHNQIVIAG